MTIKSITELFISIILKCGSVTKIKLFLQTNALTNFFAAFQLEQRSHSNTIIDLMGKEQEDRNITNRRV
jgi:hypothetical protein